MGFGVEAQAIPLYIIWAYFLGPNNVSKSGQTLRPSALA